MYNGSRELASVAKPAAPAGEDDLPVLREWVTGVVLGKLQAMAPNKGYRVVAMGYVRTAEPQPQYLHRARGIPDVVNCQGPVIWPHRICNPPVIRTGALTALMWSAGRWGPEWRCGRA